MLYRVIIAFIFTGVVLSVDISYPFALYLLPQVVVTRVD